MKYTKFRPVFIGVTIGLWAVTAHGDDQRPTALHTLQQEILVNGSSYEDLRALTTQIGPRLGGSLNAEHAVEWGVTKMKSYGFDRVWKQSVIVPHWVRGDVEKVEIVGTGVHLAVTALGRSAGTPGTQAQVIEVHSLDEVRQLGSSVSGKIVFYNRPMDPNLSDTFESYVRAVDQRTSGPNLAASLGAAAVLVRSLTTLHDDDHPHTGGTYFADGVTPIPAAALSTHGANALSQYLKNNPGAQVRIELSAATLPDVTSHNVIGEVTGREHPEEIVLVGGHLDSWDLAQGAHDDGAGVVQSLDVCRALLKLPQRPRRTVRCVLFMSEELGGIGGEEYARQAEIAHERHIMAVESDRGGFAPEKFSVNGTSQQVQKLNETISLFTGTGIQSIYLGGAGTDVDPLSSLGALTMEIIPNPTHYFDFHHAATDRFESVSEPELKRGAAALATMVYIFANQE